MSKVEAMLRYTNRCNRQLCIYGNRNGRQGGVNPDVVNDDWEGDASVGSDGGAGGGGGRGVHNNNHDNHDNVHEGGG